MAYSKIETVTARGKTRYKARVVKKNRGKKPTSICKTFDTKKEAEIFCTEQLSIFNIAPAHCVVLNSARPESKVIFRNFKQKTVFSCLGDLLKWDIAKRKAAPKQFSRSTLSTCHQPLAYDIANVHPKLLNYQHFEQYCNDRKANGACPSTINSDIINIIAAIKEAATDLPDQNLSTSNLDSYVKKLRKYGHIGKPQKRTRRFKQGEAARVFDTAHTFQANHKLNHPYPIYIELLIETCLRRSELFDLKVGDIDFENKTITVNNLKNTDRTEGHEVFVATMTSHSIELFKSLIAPGSSADTPVFPIKGGTFSGIFSDICKSAGLKDFRLHDLRREGISRKFEAGFGVIEIAKLFSGHRDISTLTEIYVELEAKNVLKKVSESNDSNLLKPSMLQEFLSYLCNDDSYDISEAQLNEVQQAFFRKKNAINSANEISQQIA